MVDKKYCEPTHFRAGMILQWMATNSNRIYSCLALVTGYMHQNCIHSTTY